MSQLEVRNITVSFDDRTVLNSISAQLVRGKVTAIVGPNGAGKSTLLECLTQLRKPKTGQVLLNGRDLSSVSPRQRARQIGYLPQNSEIAWEVDGETLIGLGRTPHTGPWGLRNADKQYVEAAIAATGTTAFKKRIVSTLSGGERARVLIARTLAGQPDWLLADEPLTGLDPGHVLDVCDLFQKLSQEDGYGIVVTLHDLSAAIRMADRVIVLSEGQIISDGSPLEALTPQILRQAYGVESSVLTGAHGPILDIYSRL